MATVRRLEKLSSVNKKLPNEILSNIKQLKNPSQIADNIASQLNITIKEKQNLLETLDVQKKIRFDYKK